jgi:dolichol-phosphate mannosyltransferase
MSGYFTIRRAAFEELAPKLSSQGFKILLDIATSARGRLRITELPYDFRGRMNCESKLDGKVALDFVALVIAKLTYDFVSYRFLMFCLVGLTGVAIHMSTLQIAFQAGALSFIAAQALATACDRHRAMAKMHYNAIRLHSALNYRPPAPQTFAPLARHLDEICRCSNLYPAGPKNPSGQPRIC